MKNMMKKVLLVVVLCVGVTFISNCKAFAAQKMTNAEMQKIVGQSKITGQLCAGTTKSNECSTIAPNPFTNGCTWVGFDSYPSCTTTGATSTSTCNSTGGTYYICESRRYNIQVAMGQKYCSQTHYTQISAPVPVTGCTS